MLPGLEHRLDGRLVAQVVVPAVVGVEADVGVGRVDQDPPGVVLDVEGDHGLLVQQFAPELLNEETAVPFYVEDDTGQVLVDPAYADVSLESDYSRSDELTDQTTVEAVLEPGEHVYVLGHAVPAEEYPQRATHRGGIVRSILRFLRGGGQRTAEEALDGEDLLITRTSSAAEFFISDTSERRGMLRLGLMATFWTLSGLIAVGGGVYFLVDGLLGL